MNSLELSFKPYKIKAVTGNATISFRVFQGSMRITLNDDNNKMIFDKSVPDNKLTILKKAIIKAINMTPGQKSPIIFSMYNTETKKAEVEWVFAISKDEKQCYHISVEWSAGGKFDFLLKGPFGISVGSDPMSEADRSASELETLIEFLKNTLPIQQTVSNYKEYWTNKIAENRGGNRGGYNKNNYSGGGAKAASSSETASTDDNYF